MAASTSMVARIIQSGLLEAMILDLNLDIVSCIQFIRHIYTYRDIQMLLYIGRKRLSPARVLLALGQKAPVGAREAPCAPK